VHIPPPCACSLYRFNPEACFICPMISMEEDPEASVSLTFRQGVYLDIHPEDFFAQLEDYPDLETSEDFLLFFFGEGLEDDAGEEF